MLEIPLKSNRNVKMSYWNLNKRRSKKICFRDELIIIFSRFGYRQYEKQTIQRNHGSFHLWNITANDTQELAQNFSQLNGEIVSDPNVFI